MEYRVRVERVRLKFAAAHMATFAGDLEPLHGHNYAVRVEVAGALTDDAWVIDFALLKRLAREICDQLDHKFLLQRNSSLIAIEEDAASWRLRFADRAYTLPRSDVLALPIENTTAERLAEHILGRLREALRQDGVTNLTSITVEVEEAPGQSGIAADRFDR